MPPEAKDLIEKFLEVDPRKRLGWDGTQKIKSHPFFKKIDWKTLREQKAYFDVKGLNESSNF